MNKTRCHAAFPRLKQATLTIALGLGMQAAMATTTAYTARLPGDDVSVPFVIGPGNITVAPGKVGYTQSQFSLSPDGMGVLDTVHLSVTSQPESLITQDLEGYYTAVNLNQNSGDALLLDDTTHAIEGISVFNKGLTFTAPASLPMVSTGGSLTIQSLNINLNDHQVYANIVGANGVGVQNNVALWRFSNTDAVLTKGTTPISFCDNYGYYRCDLNTYNPYGGMMANSISLNGADLHLTEQGLSVLSQSLGFAPQLELVFQKAGDFSFGSLTASVNFYAVPDYFASSVPEPGTWALMSLGLVGLFGVSRRKTC